MLKKLKYASYRLIVGKFYQLTHCFLLNLEKGLGNVADYLKHVAQRRSSKLLDVDVPEDLETCWHLKVMPFGLVAEFRNGSHDF